MMTTTELAIELDTTSRTLRKFLRSEGAGVGKGSRYALPSTKRDIAKMRKGFDAWEAARTAPPAIDDAPADEVAIDDDAPSLDDMNSPLDD